MQLESPPDPPDLTQSLDLENKVIAGQTVLSVVYCCSHQQQRKAKVAVKAVSFPPGFDPTERNEFIRKVKRELGIWRRLSHPNIVEFLGTASGRRCGSAYDCIVSKWMEKGTLFVYLKERETELSLLERIKLITGSVRGLAYLHSQGVVHGDLHPGNILIDATDNACLTDFGLSQTLSREPKQLAYLYTNSVRPGAAFWTAPELLYPDLYPDIKLQTTFKGDIYSFGSIIIYVLSGKFPWKDSAEAKNRSEQYQNPLRPTWPVNVADSVWEFSEKCWSPRSPKDRPSIEEVLSFCEDRLEKSLRPDFTSDINVVLFGPAGSGKSSIINLLSQRDIAPISSDAKLCTKRPRWYPVSIRGKQFRLWDTMGFFVAHEGAASRLPPYEHAHAILQNLPEGVNLILLCGHKDQICSLRRLHRLIQDSFYVGRAPIAFVITHIDEPDEDWWERNKRSIGDRTSIVVDSIPHACITTNRDAASSNRSKHLLEELLLSTAVPPVSLRPDLSSHMEATPDAAIHCGLSNAEAIELAEIFARPPPQLNVVFFGETGTGMGSIIDLVVGHPAAETNPEKISCTMGMVQLHMWNCVGKDAYERASASAAQRGGPIDLLVYCKRSGRVVCEELAGWKGTLHKVKTPVIVIITHFEPEESMEKWWETNNRGLVKGLGVDVHRYTSIPPLASNDIELEEKLVGARFSVEDLIEGCFRNSGSSGNGQRGRRR